MNINLDTWIAVLVDDLEGEVLDVVLDVLVGELATNDAFLERSALSSEHWQNTYNVKDSAFRVAGKLVLCGISNETLFISKSDPTWCDTVTLIVDENFDLAILHDADT
jgi:NAD-specific glutamate dehydrogenase